MSFTKKNLENKNGIFFSNITDSETKKVTEFYKITPFPNYKENDNKKTISEKGDKNLLAKQFKKFIGYEKNVLEVGCGTGQLSIYFGIGSNNRIVAMDPTIYSLNLAKNFVDKNNLKNIKFLNADIFDDVLSNDYFDFIWCNGVLHHTKNPYLAFQILAKSLKKNGYVLIGLYNKFGRIRTILRKYLFKIFGYKILNIFDPIILPMEIALSFLYAAIAEVASSGNDVPKATILIPITTSDIPKNLAINTEPSTNKSAPKERPTIPKITNKINSPKLSPS